MRGFVAASGGVLVCAIAALAGLASAEAKSVGEFTVGQWGGYSYSDDNNGQFVDCEIWTPVNGDNVQLGIAIPKNYSLQLWLYSKPWSLPANQSYPISYWIDRNQQYRGRAATYNQNNAVIEVESDQAVYDELKAGNELVFRTQDQDYVFDLRGSSAALSRLLNCVDQYSKAASTNPFGGGNQQSGSQQDSSQEQQGSSQQNNGQQNTGGGSDDTTLQSFTVSADNVRDFLVEVTGAKPSMVAVAEKTDKNGNPYYDLKTPLGDGQFWQEQLGGRDMSGIATGFIDWYKKDCQGALDALPKDPVRGEHGQLATGGAACSNSKYQDNGPEFMSYSLVESNGVISIYMTFVGGNAAKAKTDSLGRLIARRSADLIQ